MTIDQRERALGAAFAVLQAIPGLGKVRRLHNFTWARVDLPSIVMIDGPDAVDPQVAGLLLIRTEFLAIVAATGDSEDLVGTALNVWRAKVRAAFGADPTLGNLVQRVSYQGCSQVEPLVEEGGGPYAALQLSFVIERTEAELDPYSAMP